MTNRDKSAPDLDAKWRVDRDLRAARERSPQHLPLTHIALLSGWERSFDQSRTLAVAHGRFEQLSPLPNNWSQPPGESAWRPPQSELSQNATLTGGAGICHEERRGPRRAP